MTPCGTLDDLEIFRTIDLWKLKGKNEEVQSLEDVCALVLDECLACIKCIEAEFNGDPSNGEMYQPEVINNKDDLMAAVFHFISMILDDEIEVEVAGKHVTDFAMKGFIRGKGLGNLFKFMFHFLMHKK